MKAIVIDDDPLVAVCVTQYLEPLFDHVLVATSFLAAVDVLRAHPRVSLAIVNFQLDGGHTASELVHLFGGVGRLVLTSGNPERIPDDLTHRASKVLTKPFELAELDIFLP